VTEDEVRITYACPRCGGGSVMLHKGNIHECTCGRRFKMKGGVYV
jgi:ribosomal protein S27AE